MTLKEIAKEAGVSISTVSRVVNKNSTNAASKEVQDRIWEIVRRTGYTPNPTARDLKKGHVETPEPLSRSIACLFARTPDSMTDSFFSSLARSIEQEAFKHNYVLKYSFSSFDINHPSTFRLITDNHVDGVVILGRCDKQLLGTLKKYFNYVAYTGLNNLEAKYDQIICDGHQASLAAMEHLMELGHTRIAYIGETEAEDRYTGYCSALASRKLPLKKEYVVNVPLSSEGGYQGAKRLLEKKTDVSAFFCSNDITAIGAMHAVQEAGFNIPGDISIISIDDIDTAQYLTPMLTTVHIPVEEMGQMTAKILIDRIEGGHRLPIKMNLPFYIANRESCAVYTSKK
ncbi:LacI family DNA-binding transcriptional regulator [Clostridium sp. MCC353]|uniref:LacI family DNA-binding transcriptional regulator n=1 Tax=Clostridium sp. MCC353 TaxID=2592646 RepID=UPI001C01B79E|nr:LacI family DNA-binding transcriptional regulator [Clostridium sp. MCC353]MBT9775968.1 LacI family DNA-binding transcriptional regulator [Clostridium sp. MCC353]